jgi:hypothetical protein
MNPYKKFTKQTRYIDDIHGGNQYGERFYPISNTIGVKP